MDPSTYERRLRATEARLRDDGIDALIVAPSPDLVYLTGYAPIPMERPTVLVVTPDRVPALIVPTLERPPADRCPAAQALEVVDWPDGGDPYASIDERLPAGGTIAVADRMWAVHLLALQAIEEPRRWLGGGRILGPLRERKDPGELAALRAAARGADQALAALVERGAEGRSEREVAADLAELLVAHGHRTAAFTIVGSGPNAASPHHEPSSRTIRRGDAVVLDFGGEVEGYHSDLTRTLVVGDPPEELATVHAVVASAHAAAVDAVRPGVAIEEIDRAARSVISEAGYGDAFVHRTGHGIGLEIHEPPYAVAGDGTILEPGMTFSVEPGIYLTGRFGVRIEDIVAVTDDGVDVLNDAPRGLIGV